MRSWRTMLVVMLVAVALAGTVFRGGRRVEAAAKVHVFGDYFHFSRDLPPDTELRRVARGFLDAAPARLPHEVLMLDTGPGLKPPHGAWDGRSDAWPEAVLAQFKIAVATQAKNFREPPPPTAEQLQKGAWRALLRDGGEFYVVELAGAPLCPNDYWFTVRDRDGGVAPIVQSSAEWMQHGARGEPPPVQQVDLDGDGRMEIAFPQFDHNGTADNDDVLEYYVVRPGPQLEPVLRLRTKEWISVSSHGETGYVRRALCADGADGLRLLVWHENPTVDLPLVAVGELWLRRGAPGHRYEVRGKRCVLPGADDYLEP